MECSHMEKCNECNYTPTIKMFTGYDANYDKEISVITLTCKCPAEGKHLNVCFDAGNGASLKLDAFSRPNLVLEGEKGYSGFYASLMGLVNMWNEKGVK